MPNLTTARTVAIKLKSVDGSTFTAEVDAEGLGHASTVSSINRAFRNDAIGAEDVADVADVAKDSYEKARDAARSMMHDRKVALRNASGLERSNMLRAMLKVAGPKPRI